MKIPGLARTLALAAAAAALGGCATERGLSGPDPRSLIAVGCGVMETGACYRQASLYCPGGYTVLGREPAYQSNTILVRCR